VIRIDDHQIQGHLDVLIIRYGLTALWVTINRALARICQRKPIVKEFDLENIDFLDLVRANGL
jgi:hypothetical protein